MACYHVEAWDTLQHLFLVKKINNHVLHFSAEFSSQLNLDRMKQAVNCLADAFPLIRCGFDKDRSPRPLWVDKGHTAENMVALIQTEDLPHSVNQFLVQELDLENGPQMKVGIIRCGNTDTLCVLISHILCDAAGFKELLYTLGAIYTGLEKQTKVQVASMMKDRSLAQIPKKRSLQDRIRIYCSRSRLNPHGDQKFDFEGDLSNPFIESQKIPREQFRVLKSYAKSKGASINDIMLTAFLRVLFHMFGNTASLPCAIDLRRFLPNRKAEGICNLMSNLSCDIGPDIGENFEDTLKKVKCVMDAQKNDLGSIRNVALLEKLFSVFPYRTAYGLLEKHFSNPPIAFTNIGILDSRRLVFGDAVITEAFMTGSIKFRQYFQVSLTTFDDQATLCVNLYGTQEDRQKITAFLRDFIAELQRGAAAG